MGLLKDQEQKLCELILDNTSDSIIITDSNGFIIFWNKASELVFGWLSDEIVNNNVLFLIPERFREEHRKAFASAVYSKKLSLNSNYSELRALHKKGHEIIVNMSISMIENGKLYLVGILKDITKEKEIQQDLIKKTEAAQAIYQQALAYAADIKELGGTLHDSEQKQFWKEILESIANG